MDLALHLLARLGSTGQSKLVQLFGEYDPHPPLGRIDWSAVDEDALLPTLAAQRPTLESTLARRPDVLAAVDRLLARAGLAHPAAAAPHHAAQEEPRWNRRSSPS